MDIEKLTLSQIREIKRFTQSEVREQLNLKERGFRMKEKGENEFKLSEAVKLAKIYNITLEQFVTIVENTIDYEKLKK